MNLNQFTVKAQEAVVDAQALALKKNHQSVEAEHLASTLLQQKDSAVPQCIEKIKAGALKSLLQGVQDLVAKRPQIQGDVQPYLSGTLNRVLVFSEEESKSLRDDFISTEHLFLGLFKIKEGALAELLQKMGIQRTAFLEALKTVRGNQRVTDQTPEENTMPLNVTLAISPLRPLTDA
jgi:ATP-dependent Clp protease ATP-binding subunit ClpB